VPEPRLHHGRAGRHAAVHRARRRPALPNRGVRQVRPGRHAALYRTRRRQALRDRRLPQAGAPPLHLLLAVPQRYACAAAAAYGGIHGGEHGALAQRFRLLLRRCRQRRRAAPQRPVKSSAMTPGPREVVHTFTTFPPLLT
jgi:hypothetical protein